MTLWTPTRDAEEGRREYAATLLDRVHEQIDHYNRELQQIDPHLQLVRADPRSEHSQLRPGFYHLIHTPPDKPPTIKVIETPDGGFREPDSSIFEELRHDDMQNARSRRERERRQRAYKRAADREREREADDRREELTQRVLSLKNTSVSVPRDI